MWVRDCEILILVETRGSDMNYKRIFVRFLSIAVLGFAVTAAVTYLYSLIAHSAGAVDWGTALRTAIILGIVLTFIFGRKATK